MLDLDSSFAQKSRKESSPEDFLTNCVSIIIGASRVKALGWLKKDRQNGQTERKKEEVDE